MEDAVEIENLDSDKYTMHGFPLSTLRHIAASSMLLKLLLPDELDDLLSTCKVRTFPEGSMVMKQGQSFESNLSETKFWALCEGAADVYVDGNLVAEIVAGQVMGEMSVVRGMERTATVLAGDDVVAVEMTRGDLERALAKRPEVWGELWRLVDERLKAPVFYSSISDDAEETVVANVRIAIHRDSSFLPSATRSQPFPPVQSLGFLKWQLNLGRSFQRLHRVAALQDRFFISAKPLHFPSFLPRDLFHSGDNDRYEYPLHSIHGRR